MAVIDIQVPDIGDFDEVGVIEILVQPGQRVELEQSLITVESDKASMEIPSSAAGKVKSIKVKVGDKVSEGSVVLELEAQAEGASEAPAAQAAPAQASAAEAPAAQAAQPAASASSGPVTVTVPDIGDFAEVEVIEVLVAVGDTVKAEQSLITVESDKASMEIPSSAAGVITALNVKVGDKVSKGSDILQLAPSGGAAASAPAPASEAPKAQAQQAAAPAPAAQAAPAAAQPASPTQDLYPDGTPLRKLPHASPSVRKFARELGVDLNRVQGSGDKGRITADDVRGFVKQVMAGGGAPATAAPAAAGGGLSVLDWPKVDFTKFGPIESKPLSRIKKISGANLHRNWVMIPHVTNNEQADITELEALRQTLNKENQKSGAKVTMLAFLIKAVVAALKKFPEFNASLDGDNLVLKQYYHIGFAADTPRMATSGALMMGVNEVPPIPPSDEIEKQPPCICEGESLPSRARPASSEVSLASSITPLRSASRMTGTTSPLGVSAAKPMW